MHFTSRDYTLPDGYAIIYEMDFMMSMPMIYIIAGEDHQDFGKSWSSNRITELHTCQTESTINRNITMRAAAYLFSMGIVSGLTAMAVPTSPTSSNCLPVVDLGYVSQHAQCPCGFSGKGGSH